MPYYSRFCCFVLCLLAAERIHAAPVAESVSTEEQPLLTTSDALSPELVSNPPNSQLPEEVVLREFLTIPRVGAYGGRVVHTDPVDHALATETWTPPQAGDELRAATGEFMSWEVARADTKGRLSGPATGGGYAYATFESPQARTMLLQATRHAAVRVNGRWLAGNPYGYESPSMPVSIQAGQNTFLFHLAQPGFAAKLVACDSGVSLSDQDTTAPDVPANGADRLWAAAPVINATARTIQGGQVRVTIGSAEDTSPLPAIEPFSITKAPFRLPAVDAGETDVNCLVAVYLPRIDTGTLSPDPVCELTLTLRRVQPGETHTQTFVSRIDGSVQPYSVVPATEQASDNRTGLILALHGLGTNHAAFAKYFKPKTWAHIVVPQNRRSFGFDWEDWGAADAMEALGYARKRLIHNPRRTYVTGHGMGGHGAWLLAMKHPDQFAAVGPSAGWIDHKGGGAETDNAAVGVLNRGQNRTAVAIASRNLAKVGVYLLHGEKDQRVEPAQSRYMRSRLGAFHNDFVYYERPGAGHWWGPDTVDWQPMMDFFRQRQLPTPETVRHIDFATAHPGDSSRCHWATIDAQQRSLEPSRVTLTHNPGSKSITGRTENVARLKLDLSKIAPSGSQSLRLDDSRTLRIGSSRSRQVWLEHDAKGRWKVASPPPRTLKSRRRGGLLKSVFDKRPLLVYATGGSQQENDWAKSKALFDAHSFWKRGNGSFEVLPDTALEATREPNRNVVLYGNAGTNKAWPQLLSTSPIQVRGDRVNVSAKASSRPEMGDDLAVLMVRPRPGSNTASVAVIGGTGITGMRLTNRLRYFVSGVTYPDFVVFGPGALENENQDIRAAGYFGNDWSVNTGEVLWRDLAL